LYVKFINVEPKMHKKLYRSSTTKMIGGVSGGLSDYFQIDPVIFRVIFIITAIAGGGTGLLVYIVLWIIVPLEDARNLDDSSFRDIPEPIEKTKGDGTVKYFFGIVLIVIGASIYLSNFIPNFSWNYIWPIVLIALGALILINSKKTELL